MDAWLLMPLLFASGYLLGRWQNRRWRYDRVAAAQRLLQLKVLSLELKSLRSKVVSAQGMRTPPAKRRLVRKRPTLQWWQRRVIAWLHMRLPRLTRFMRFSPGTYIRWLQARSRAGHIARMLSGGELKFRISKKTVAQILKAHGFKPKPKGKRPPRQEEPGWLTTLYNQHVMAIDFKIVHDLAGKTMAVLNLIDHGRRALHWSRATYHPTAEWVAQQLRNAFMDMDNLPQAIVMDRDSIFLPIVKQTLPNMGIKPNRSATGT